MTEKLLTSPSPTSPDPGDGVNRSNSTFSRTASTQTNKEICTRRTCEDPGIFCRGGGGGGVGAGASRLLNLFYSLQRGSNGFITHFPGASNFFQEGGGVQMLISIETHITITCDFPGGVWIPYSPSGSAHGQCGILA